MQIIKREVKVAEEVNNQLPMRVDYIDNCRVSLRFPTNSNLPETVINLTKEETEKLRKCLI